MATCDSDSGFYLPVINTWGLIFSRGIASFFACGVSWSQVRRKARACDIAVFMSVADNTEPVFTAYQKNLPSFRALVHIGKSGNYLHFIDDFW